MTMTKYILSMFLIAALSAATTVKAMASSMVEIELIDNDFNKVVITANGSVLRITGAEGLTMCVYNVAGGQPVMKSRIDSQDKSFELNLPKGVYIVQVGNKAARKIVVK